MNEFLRREEGRLQRESEYGLREGRRMTCFTEGQGFDMNGERKGLDGKNRLYSLILAAALLAGLVGYFICMLPSLYVSYRREQNLKSVLRQHIAYVESGNYSNVKAANPVTCFSVRIPNAADTFFLAGPFWELEVTAKTTQAREAFSSLRQLLRRWQNGDFPEDDTEDRFLEEMEAWRNVWKDSLKEVSSALPVRIDFRLTDRLEYSGESSRLHRMSDEVLILEAEAGNGDNIYTNYIALEDTGDALVFTCLPAVTPDMWEIRPVVLQSLPMLAAVILLLVLLFSQGYSRGILQPVYRELEEKNKALQEENKRQEVFMRASSHQLKTPLSAALLLLDGMINRVGKYQDTALYLPRVKEQLLSMRKMVEDILSLNHCGEPVRLQELQILPLLEDGLSAYQVRILDKGLQVSCSGEGGAIQADETLLLQILDNLLSNAVEYTPDGSRIEIRVSQTAIFLENYGVTIPETILPHVFDPFVSGNHERKLASHGLGLYIAACYARQLGFSVEIKNRENSVLAALYFS